MVRQEWCFGVECYWCVLYLYFVEQICVCELVCQIVVVYDLDVVFFCCCDYFGMY